MVKFVLHQIVSSHLHSASTRCYYCQHVLWRTPNVLQVERKERKSDLSLLFGYKNGDYLSEVTTNMYMNLV